MKERVPFKDLAFEFNEAGTAICLFDADGEFLGTLPVGFTDAQIKAIVSLANGWFDKGYEFGRFDAQAQIRAAIGMTS